MTAAYSLPLADIFHEQLQSFVNVHVGRRTKVWRDKRACPLTSMHAIVTGSANADCNRCSAGGIFLAFSTASPRTAGEPEKASVEMLDNVRMDALFEATVQATEE